MKTRETLRLLAPYIGLAATCFLFSLLGPASFHSAYNLKTILTQSVIVGIGALGMTFVIISGGIDLSVGSLIALSTVLMARMLNLHGTDSDVTGWLPWAAGLVAIGI